MNLAFFDVGGKDKNLHFRKERISSQSHLSWLTALGGCRQTLQNQYSELWGVILSSKGEKFPFTLQSN